MSLPELTALQFKIIGILRGSEMKGRDVRARLAHDGITLGGPSFYQAMSRLADAGFVKIIRLEREILDTPVSETSYRVSGPGERAYLQTLAFYRVPTVKGVGGMRHA